MDLDLIMNEIKLLEDTHDCFGYNLKDSKGLFVIVVDYGDGKEYLYEMNEIDNDGCFIPYGSNLSSPYGDLEKAMEVVQFCIDNK